MSPPPAKATSGFDELLLQRRRQIDDALDLMLPPADDPPEQLHQAMRHSVQAGGKRLRPFMVLKSCMMLGGKQSDAMAAAGAVEMIHNFTLTLTPFLSQVDPYTYDSPSTLVLLTTFLSQVGRYETAAPWPSHINLTTLSWHGYLTVTSTFFFFFFFFVDWSFPNNLRLLMLSQIAEQETP